MFSKFHNGRKARSAPSIICANCHISGDLLGQGELQIDGQIEGNVQCDNLVIGISGSISGEVHADSVLVMGKVTGQIKARSVELTNTARIYGDVIYDSLSIATGAQVESGFHHMPSPQISTAIDQSRPSDFNPHPLLGTAPSEALQQRR